MVGVRRGPGDRADDPAALWSLLEKGVESTSEVPASMDRAQALAQMLGADIVLATDPDADRIGAMIPDKDGFRFLNGNTIAALLTHFKLAKLADGSVKFIKESVSMRVFMKDP